MIKRFFKKISGSFCIYLAVALNLADAIRKQDFDWLLWVSLCLTALSLILALISAIRGGDNDVET